MELADFFAIGDLAYAIPGNTNDSEENDLVIYDLSNGSDMEEIGRLDMQYAEGLGWDGLGTTGWSASTYAEYCEQLRDWADQAAVSLGRSVAADEVERWLFER